MDRVRGERNAERIAVGAGILAALVGLIVLLGWALDATLLKSLHPGWVSMKPNTAVAVLLGGVGILIQIMARGRPGVLRAATGCAAGVALIGGITLVEYLTGWAPPFDQVLFRDDPGNLGASHPGRMAFSSTVAFVLLSVGLAPAFAARRPVVADACGVLALAMGITTLVGYGFGHAGPDDLPAFARMAVHTAASTVLIGIGVICVNPEGGLAARFIGPGLGPRLARRLLPAIILVPLLFAWAVGYGWEAGWYGHAFSETIQAVGTIALLSVLAFWTVTALDTFDRRSRSLDRFHGIVHHATDATIVVDSAGRIVLANELADRLFGRHGGALVGQPMEILLPERLRTRHAAHLTGYFANPSPRMMGRDLVLHGRRENGTEFPIEVGLTPVEAAEGMHALAVIRDVTDAVRKAETLELYSSLSRHAPVGLVVYQLVDEADAMSLTLTACNPAAERILGMPMGERIGERMCDLFPATVTPELAEMYAEIIRTLRSRDIGVLPGQDPSIAGRQFHISAFPLPARSVALAFEDVTERLAADERLRREVEATAAANRELEAFSYSVSHDLRAPLRAIDGFSRMLLDESADRLDDRGRRHLDRIRRGAQTMGTLIDELIGLARLARQDLRHEPVDLGRLAREAVDGLRQAEPDRRVEVAIADGMAAEGDPTLMAVVFDNLVGNAWKFTARQPAARIEVGVGVDASGEREFFVRDNGAGFDPAYADKLFGTFQRLHSAEEFPGTGIGLASVQRIIQRHGGRIRAEGAVGAGAAFYFTLPPQGGPRHA